MSEIIFSLGPCDSLGDMIVNDNWDILGCDLFDQSFIDFKIIYNFNF